MKSSTLSIKTIGVILFIVLITASSGTVGYFIFSGWLSSTEETAGRLAYELNSRVFSRIGEHMNSPLHLIEVYKDQIEKGVIDLNDENQRERFFSSVLTTHNQGLYSFSFGSEEGEYYGARRNPQGGIEIMRNNRSTGGASWYYSLKDDFTAGELALKAGTFDPRTRDWYRAAKTLGKPVFSPVYRHFIMPDLTVSAAAPVAGRDGKLLGVLGAHITLSGINSSLEELAEEAGGMAAIVEKRSGALIGNSIGMDNFRTLPDGTFRRLTPADGENRILQQAAELYARGKGNTVKVSDQQTSFIVHINEFRREGVDWLVLFALPESLFTAGIFHTMRFSLLLTVLAVLAAALVCAKAASVLMKPLENLVTTAESLSSGDLSRRAEVRRNDEIGRVARAVNIMAEKLEHMIASLGETVRERTAELEERNRELDQNRSHLKLILDSAAEGIYGIDRKGNCTFANAGCLKMLGYGSQEDLSGKNMHFLIHYAHRDGRLMDPEECKIFSSLRTGRGIRVDDEVFWTSGGTPLDVAYSSYPQFRNGELTGAVVTFTDNTERRKSEARINFLTYHDSLTGLYNRAFFEEELKRMDRDENLPLAVIFGDVNGLKLTNDIFGHSAGDELLKKSAEALRKSCRESDIIARVGGDEFTIILPRAKPEDVRKLIGRIKGEISKLRVRAIKGSIALGFSVKTDPGQSVQETLREAEEAMYREKDLGRKAESLETISAIMETLHEKSPCQKQHSENVSRICMEIGHALNMPETETRKLKEAGFLHDIGKIVVDEDVLNEAGCLFPGEEDSDGEMKKHPVAGFRILNLYDETMDLGESVLNHHENWDGSGYPRGIGGEEIPQMARILRAGEAFDDLLESMEEGRMTGEEVLEQILKLRGTSLDPAVADILISMVRKAEEGDTAGGLADNS
ncbi:PAS domain S-box-containing protein/diguanylate cyclase (GGDEF)-like protein [Aminivibrio pyruvatiphilus]|uniref:PAS domain S-box-containing protein/diguanylate cyclase (GGDEF)-like protein n=1 Tax=Aminivibrio pyruvatiphilus TaxID=1005740 RepID=A0A4R8M5X7_9BACT|nr:diguanylate cyclase [Aminivibrio pyruvatiphilus]TDY55960.1 PAS domain S-box-containing protein/diguanylate cyclase (GGDEF)-like protein [Aminivibrio pyruvatiphilus]